MKPSIFFLIISVMTVSACSTPYTVTLNENVLYTPNPSAINNGLMADPNLQGCLNQVFISSGHNDPEQITLLACPSAGIQSLIGIEVLVNLEQIDLSGNVINDISPMINLKKLRVLSMQNNRIGSISALFSLPILRFVSLQGNSTISCRELDRLAERIGPTLNRPQNCS